MICQREGCNATATHFPRICVPAKTLIGNESEPISAIFGVHCCLPCCKALAPSDFLDVNMPRNLHDLFEILAAHRQLYLDYDKAFIQPTDFAEESAQVLEEDMRKHGAAHLHAPGHA